MAVPDPAPDSGAGSPDSTDLPRVLVDVMCGTLATHLRMCGYDAAYALDEGIEADDAARPAYIPDDGPDRYWRCRDCGQWFWKGGHWASVAERLSAIRE